MTENKFNQWCMQATLARKRLLQLLKIDTWDQIKDIFDSEDYLLKFFTYKVLTRRYMPAFGFDGDRIFWKTFAH